MKFFDCNCSFGNHPRPTFRHAKDSEELMQELDFCGIERALVFHSGMRFSSPLDWNEELSREIAGRPRLFPVGPFYRLRRGNSLIPSFFARR